VVLLTGYVAYHGPAGAFEARYSIADISLVLSASNNRKSKGGFGSDCYSTRAGGAAM